MVDQILKGTAAEVRVTLYVAGAPTDADALPKVTVVRDSDGSTLVSNQTATDVAGTGVYSYTLTPANIADLDLLRITWTATLAGVAGQTFTTLVEVVGGYITTLSAIEAAVAQTETPSAADVVDARQWAERWLEDECQVAFRPRYRRERLDGSGRLTLKLHRARPLRLRSLTIDGTALAPADLALVTLKPGGVLYRDNGFSNLRPGNVDVVYEYGWESAPEPVIRAATRLAAFYLTPNPFSYDERASSISTDEASYTLVTPGLRGAVHSLPEVNAVVDQYAYRSAG